MKPGKILKAIREEKGMEPFEMAKRIGISLNEYYDLEWDDEYSEELEDRCALSTLFKICEILEIDPSRLFNFSQVSDADVTVEEFRHRLARFLKEQNLSSEAFVEICDWDVTPIVDGSGSVNDYTVDGLRQICKFSSMRWEVVLTGLFREYRRKQMGQS